MRDWCLFLPSPWTIIKLSVYTNLLKLWCLWCINKYGCLIDDNNLKDMLETDASSSSKSILSAVTQALPDVSVHTEHTEVLFVQTAVIQNRPLSEDMYWLTGGQNMGRHIINHFYAASLHVKTFFPERRFIWNTFHIVLYHLLKTLRNRVVPQILKLCIIIIISFFSKESKKSSFFSQLFSSGNAQSNFTMHSNNEVQANRSMHLCIDRKLYKFWFEKNH